MLETKKVELLIHNIRSVYNVGAIFRTAEALGVDKIWLSGYSPRPIDRFGRKRKDLAKVSLGAEDNIKWEDIDNHIGFIKTKKDERVQVVALEQSGDSVALKDFRTDESILLIVGTETTGIDQELIDLSDVIIEIKQTGQKRVS